MYKVFFTTDVAKMLRGVLTTKPTMTEYNAQKTCSAPFSVCISTGLFI